MQKFLIATLLLTLSAGAALADEWYVAQDPATKQCKIVNTKPDGKTMIMIGDAYETKGEAFMAAAQDKDDCQN